MNSEFIDAIKKCKYYGEIFSGKNVAFVFLGGSRLIKNPDSKSDYDINVVTVDDEGFSHCNKCLTYKGVKVHWYYRSLKTLVSPLHPLVSVGNSQLAYLTEKDIIYVNPTYQKEYDNFLSNIQWISRLASYQLYEKQKDIIAKIIGQGEIKEEDKTKFLHHLCLSSYILTGEKEDWPALSSIKRIRWEEVPSEYQAIAVERIKVLDKYIKDNPIDVLAETEAINKILENKKT